jgi:hypothetical protein
MLEDVIALAGEYFSMIMLVLAIVIATVIAAWRRDSARKAYASELFRWVSLLGAGVVGLYTFAGNVFAPAQVAAHIGWETSPFQYEVGMADLTMGVLGVLAFRASFGFRLATTIAAVCWLGGDAIGHVRQIVIAGNYAPGNAGPWLWSDILVPLILVATLALSARDDEAAAYRSSDSSMPKPC